MEGSRIAWPLGQLRICNAPSSATVGGARARHVGGQPPTSPALAKRKKMAQGAEGLTVPLALPPYPCPSPGNWTGRARSHTREGQVCSPATKSGTWSLQDLLRGPSKTGRGTRSPLTALTQGWRRFAKTTTRLGEDQQLRVRDCGKDEFVVKHTLHLDMAARPGQQCMLCRYGGGLPGWLPQKPRVQTGGHARRSLPDGGTSRPLGTHSGPVHAEDRR